MGAVLLMSLLLSQAHAASQKCLSNKDIADKEVAMWLDGTAASQEALIGCVDEAWRHFETDEQVIGTEFVNRPSRELIAAFKFNPTHFMSVMDTHPWLRDRWLRDIDFDAFTWYDDPPCGFEPQIADILLALAAIHGSARNSVSYQKIHDRFQNLTCHQID